MAVLSGWLGWGPSFANGGCCSASRRASANTKCCVSECWPCCPLPSIAPCIITPAGHPTPLPSRIQCYNPTPPPFPPGAGGSWGDLTLGSFPPPPWWGRRQGRVWGEAFGKGSGERVSLPLFPYISMVSQPQTACEPGCVLHAPPSPTPCDEFCPFCQWLFFSPLGGDFLWGGAPPPLQCL